MVILFVCTGNTCRSSMAEAMFRELTAGEDKYKDVKILSAGTWTVPGQRASKNAIEVLKNRNIDLNNHASKPLTKEMAEEADLILTMTRNHKRQILHAMPEAKEKTYTLKEYAYGEDYNLDISDPYGQDAQEYKACADEIEEALKKVIKKYYS